MFQIMRDTILALTKMHCEGIAHRDIKPENILWVSDKWKLGDLGVSRSLQGDIERRKGDGEQY